MILDFSMWNYAPSGKSVDRRSDRDNCASSFKRCCLPALDANRHGVTKKKKVAMFPYF